MDPSRNKSDTDGNSSYHTIKNIDEFIYQIRKQKQIERHKITLFRNPSLALKYLTKIIYSSLKRFTLYILRHWIVRKLFVPIFLTIGALLYFLDVHPFESHYFIELYISLKLITWWVGLGILSSIGLGSGMHSGLLFLFPHFFFICATLEKCSTLDFDARLNMWNNVMRPGDLFQCPTYESDNSSELRMNGDITFLNIVFKIFPYAFLWGIGTVIGELPPYATSYYAAKSKLADEEFEEIDRELNSNQKSYLTRIKLWMMNLVEKYGVLSVILLSCWPNVLFDLCGIVCGHFMMPFWRFFFSLFIGKAVIKIIFQCIFFVFLFSSRFDMFRAQFITHLFKVWPLNKLIERIFGDPRMFEEFILKEIQYFRSGMKSGKEASKFSNFFSLIVTLLILYFFITCINQIAQSYQKKIDDSEINRITEQLKADKAK